MKKAVSGGSALLDSPVHRFFGARLRRGPRNDIQIVQQRVAWTNVSGGVLAERGADVYE
jgi:hypothetical protein